MELWVRITLQLCVFGVLKETRPSEPFITKYLTNPPMNFTDEQVYLEIYPVSTYSMLAMCILVFLITDLIRYKPIILLLSMSGSITYLMLIFGRSLFVMQILEVLYGLFYVCEVAYYTYIYAKVDKSHFQEVTGYTRAAYLVGRALSGVISQILVSSGVSYYALQWVTFGALTLSGIWALFLPQVETSIYFNPVLIDQQTGDQLKVPFWSKFTYGFRELWMDFLAAFKSFYIVKWMFWWALATCGYYQLLQYVQPLWEQILRDRPQSGGDLNGLVETSYTLLSAASAYGFGKFNADWSKYGELVLAVGSLAIAGILICMSRTMSIAVAFVCHVLYAIVYNSIITIANSEVAKNIKPDSYGLIFGFTTFVALLLETILTIIVIEKLELNPRDQFLVYGGYFLVLGALFTLKTLFDAIVRLVRRFSGSSPTTIVLDSQAPVQL